jgi:hypothetical protein
MGRAEVEFVVWVGCRNVEISEFLESLGCVALASRVPNIFF